MSKTSAVDLLNRFLTAFGMTSVAAGLVKEIGGEANFLHHFLHQLCHSERLHD